MPAGCGALQDYALPIVLHGTRAKMTQAIRKELAVYGIRGYNPCEWTILPSLVTCPLSSPAYSIVGGFIPVFVWFTLADTPEELERMGVEARCVVLMGGLTHLVSWAGLIGLCMCTLP